MLNSREETTDQRKMFDRITYLSASFFRRAILSKFDMTEASGDPEAPPQCLNCGGDASSYAYLRPSKRNRGSSWAALDDLPD
jgi:hypothetical protein